MEGPTAEYLAKIAKRAGGQTEEEIHQALQLAASLGLSEVFMDMDVDNQRAFIKWATPRGFKTGVSSNGLFYISWAHLI